MQTGRDAQVFASGVVDSGETGAVPEPFARAYEEVNDVSVAVLSIRYSVLAEHAGRLHEQLPRPRPLRRLLQFLRRLKLNHRFTPLHETFFFVST